MHRGFRYELKPTPAQAQTLREWVGVTRLVYNLCLEQRRDFWRQYRRQTGKALNWAAQSREVTDLRLAFDWISAVPRSALEQAVRDVEGAYSAFFSRRTGYPSPRAKGRHDSLRLQGRDVEFRRLNGKWSAVRLPKLGWVKYRDTRPLVGRVLHVTLSLRAGVWAVAVAQEIVADTPAMLPERVGIDRGIAHTLTLSTGEVFQAPALGDLSQRIVRARRVLGRRKRGSKRYSAQRAKLSRITARAARIRSDWTHRASSLIAARFGVVAIEALHVTSMTASAKGTVAEPGRKVRQKSGLNRAILEQCWGQFAQRLDYKLTDRGGMLIAVPAAYTSQTCAGCGVVDARSRKSQAVFACVHCGHEDNADVNAAKEILRRSTASMGVEGSHWRPAEALIMAAA
jgi:putative transposase